MELKGSGDLLEPQEAIVTFTHSSTSLASIMKIWRRCGAGDTEVMLGSASDDIRQTANSRSSADKRNRQEKAARKVR
jgi:hypothetical protein